MAVQYFRVVLSLLESSISPDKVFAWDRGVHPAPAPVRVSRGSGNWVRFVFSAFGFDGGLAARGVAPAAFSAGLAAASAVWPRTASASAARARRSPAVWTGRGEPSASSSIFQ